MSKRTRTSAVIAAVTSLVLALITSLLATSPAQADDEKLRDRAHARIAAILSQAVDDGVFSEAQENYVTSALLPIWVDPKDLSKRAERKTIGAFWQFVGESSGLDEEQVMSRLSRGQTLARIAGDGADDLRDRIYKWLARPVAAAVFDGELTYIESIELREDIQRAVYRMMIQSGGGDRAVTPSPRRR